MTGREGETFPGFFYGRRGQPDTDEREVRSSQEEGDGLGMPSLGVCRHLWGWKRHLAGGSDGVFVALYRRCAERQGDALRGAHSGVACSGTFLGGSMLLAKKSNIFLCLFGMLIE